MKIREELMTAAEIAPKRGESERDFLIRLQKQIGSGISEDVWNNLSDEAQDWNNDAADAIDEGKPIAGFKDEAAEQPPAAGGRRRGAAAAEPDPEPEEAAYEPKLADKVKVVTARGKTIEGIVVEIGDGMLITNPDGDQGDEEKDSEFDLDKVTVTKIEPEPEPAPTGRRGRGASTAKAEEPADPEVGDTVEAITARDKVIVGVIVELADDDMLLKDVTGTEHELTVSKLKSVKVKVKGKPAAKAAATEPAASGRRGRGAAKAAAPDDDAKRAAPGMGNRVRELCCADNEASIEDIMKSLKKEGIEFREISVKMIWKDTHFVIDELRKHKKLK